MTEQIKYPVESDDNVCLKAELPKIMTLTRVQDVQFECVNVDVSEVRFLL